MDKNPGLRPIGVGEVMRRIIGRSVKESEMKITAEGQRHLGAVIGDLKFKQGYIDDMVSDWMKELNILADVAKFHP